MARYEIKESAYVRLDPKVPESEEYFFADRQNPKVIVVPDEVEPSIKWIPLDEGARAAKKKLADFRALPLEKKQEEIDKRTQAQEEADVKAAETRYKASKKSASEEETGGTQLANPVPADAHSRGKERARTSDKPVI